MSLIKALEDKNKILRGIRVKLLTTSDDDERLSQLCYTRELAYDWAIDKLWKKYNSYKENMNDYKVLTYMDLNREFVKYRKTCDCIDLLKSIHLGVATVAFKDAIKTFKRLKNRIPYNEKPRYHGKHRRKHMSVGLRSDNSYIKDGNLYTGNMAGLPRICIALANPELTGYGGNLKIRGIKTPWYNPRVVNYSDGWYLCFSIPRTRKSLENIPISEPIGIDLGCVTTFQLSTEEFFNQPDVSRIRERISILDNKINRLYRFRKRRAYEQHLHVWEIPRSNTEVKLIDRRNKAYKKIHNKLEYFYYQVINDIVKRNPEAIILETIYVKRLRRIIDAPDIRREIHQVYFCMIRYMFEAKCDEYGIPLYEVNNEYPSSLLCNNCGYKHTKLGKSRTFVCPNCGYVADRDLNASRNLRDVYVNKEVDNIKWWNGHGSKLILMDRLTHI